MSDIVLKDKNGADNTYSGVNFVMLRNANGEYDKYITEPQGDLEITENGNFDVKDKATVTVAVPSESPILEEIEITENGEYTPSGDGFSKVVVNVPTYITVSSVEELNNTVAPDGTIAIVR